MSLSSSSPQTRLSSAEDLISSVRGLQQFSAVRAGVAKKSSSTLMRRNPDARQEEEVALELRCPKTGLTKYALYLVDLDQDEKLKKKVKKFPLKFAVFIVPQGR